MTSLEKGTTEQENEEEICVQNKKGTLAQNSDNNINGNDSLGANTIMVSERSASRDDNKKPESKLITEENGTGGLCSNLETQNKQECSLEVKKDIKDDNTNKSLGHEINESVNTASEFLGKKKDTDKDISEHKAYEQNFEKDEQFSNDDYAEHISYQEDGSAIFVDPKTKIKYKFSDSTNSWEQIEDDTIKTNPYENEHYRWCFETNQWIPKTQTNVQYSFVDGFHTYKDEDGTVFFYDESKKAWFPKIDDDFMAIYQLNYGFDKDGNQNRKVVDEDGFKIPISIKENIAEKSQNKKQDKESKTTEKVEQNKKRKAPEPPKWFDITPEQNTKVYVSNLPLDITEQEFIDVMSKCGLIMKDQNTQKFKIKLYVDSNGILKGDGLCDYIKVESVDLALKILDGYDVRGKQINVQRAKFEMRGEYNPALKPKKKKKDKQKLAKLKEKLLDWRPDKMRGERSKHERVVVLKNLFDPQIFNENVELILEYQNDLREECKKCGNVRKVIIYDRHPDGIASISMSCPEEADLVVQLMNRRFYGKRRLVAEIWDGKTRYKIDETTNEKQDRLSNWDKFLDGENNEKSSEIKNVKTDEIVLKDIKNSEIPETFSESAEDVVTKTVSNIEPQVI
ncbi:HIV Tat-specific factor 1 [Condylostylus longicornis]|uniref:HIV Tat-specific factor 1 n=1 Tax=Condylostylus longicornis TaxID=2530218 RepID=UPI00244E304A|nr:HIV Tat-specific factor 1 [Condylostylus longicornis]